MPKNSTDGTRKPFFPNDIRANRCYIASVHQSALMSKQVNLTRNPEAVVKLLSRGVIQRVIRESPGCSLAELRQRIQAATPFTESESPFESIWEEEVKTALRLLEAKSH